MSQLLRCNYCLKDFFIHHLMIVFLILVDVFNVSQHSIRVYLSYKKNKGIFVKMFKKLQQLMIALVLMFFGFSSYNKDRRE
jgi:hypothetical protein